MRALGHSGRGEFDASAGPAKQLPARVLPWHVSLLLGEAVFAGLKWVLPAMSSSSLFFKPIAMALAGVALPAAGMFVLLCAVVFSAPEGRRRDG